MEVPKAFLYIISTQNLHSLCTQLNGREVAQSSTRKEKSPKFVIHFTRKFLLMLLNSGTRWMAANWARNRENRTIVMSQR